MSDPIHTVFEGKHLSLCRRGTWEYASRRNVSGVAGIVGVTDDGRLLLVEQYRPALDRSVIELPAGLAGDHPGAEDEQTITAARRELEEETGYTCRDMTPLATGAASAGLCDEIISLFHATGLSKVHDGPMDASENITLHEVAVNDVPAFLQRQQSAGKQVDLKVYCALYFVARASRP